jgi:hypothetical protein
MDDATKAQLISQIEGLQLAMSIIASRPTANACSHLPEMEQALGSLRGELLDAGGMRRPSAVAATTN